jgi:hypothetical protein
VLALGVLGGAVLALVGTTSALAVMHDGPNVPPEKQAVLAKALGPPAHPGPPAAKGRGVHAPPAAPPTPPAHAGQVGTPAELGGVPVPFSAATFQVTNMWMDLRGQVEIHVYAGSVPSDPQQGALVVTRTNAVTGEDLPGAGQFTTSSKVGALTLTSVRGNTVSFTYAGGSGTFNLVSGDFSM